MKKENLLQNTSLAEQQEETNGSQGDYVAEAMSRWTLQSIKGKPAEVVALLRLELEMLVDERIKDYGVSFGDHLSPA